MPRLTYAEQHGWLTYPVMDLKQQRSEYMREYMRARRERWKNEGKNHEGKPRKRQWTRRKPISPA